MSSSAKNASPPSINFCARFFRSASSASVIVARLPHTAGRSSGVMPLLAQTPCMSGLPSGMRGTDHVDLLGACAESPTARTATTMDVMIRARMWTSRTALVRLKPDTTLLLQERVHVTCRQYVIGIRTDRDVLHVIGNVGEAVIHAGRDDDDVARADFSSLRRLLEHALVAGANRDLYDLAVRGKRLRAVHGAAGEQCP